MKSRVENVVMLDYSEDMSYAEARKRSGQVVTKIKTVSDSETGWSFSIYNKVLRVQGKKVYLKSTRSFDLAYRSYTRLGKKTKKWIGDPKNLTMGNLKMILMHFKCDWAINMLEEYKYMSFFIKKKSVLYKIVNGSITSYEDLYKYLAKSVYKVKLNVPSMKIYCKYVDDIHRCRISIYDIMDFTTNPNMFFQKYQEYISRQDRTEWILCDTLLTAAMLGKTVNPSWSPRRLEEEHASHILEINSKDLSDKADNTLYEDISKAETRNVKILNSEREIFEYACKYQNCIYTNYYSRIAEGSYIAAIITLNGEEAMLGISRYNNTIAYNQCFRKYNNRTSNVMIDFAIKYITDYSKELEKLKVCDDISKRASASTNVAYAEPFALPY